MTVDDWAPRQDSLASAIHLLGVACEHVCFLLILCVGIIAELFIVCKIVDSLGSRMSSVWPALSVMLAVISRQGGLLFESSLKLITREYISTASIKFSLRLYMVVYLPSHAIAARVATPDLFLNLTTEIRSNKIPQTNFLTT